ncbi:unnamed protein product [Meloidogyne enterolobii]|uniref:Uncharacterized protein n=1 Tax=Meloidogyne enterolobii TaxID=390850 RepID=A0ACB1AYK4_MELEN
MPPQGKNKNKKVSQLGGTISGPKSSGRNNGQKRFEEAGESSSSSKQNEETKKVLKGKENVKPKEVPSSSEQSPEIKASNPSKVLSNFLVSFYF